MPCCYFACLSPPFCYYNKKINFNALKYKNFNNFLNKQPGKVKNGGSSFSVEVGGIPKESAKPYFPPLKCLVKDQIINKGKEDSYRGEKNYLKEMRVAATFKLRKRKLIHKNAG